MASLMTVFEACRQECREDETRNIEQHRCLTYHVDKYTMVLRLHYSEWNTLMPSSTSMNGVLVRCYFNKRQPKSNYIVAYGSTKASSKRAILDFIQRYPLCTFEPSTIQQPTPKVPVSVSPYTTSMVTS